MTYCAIETNLTTSQFTHPFQNGWLDTPDWLVLRDQVTPEFLNDREACVLVDAITATRYLDTHSVVADIALVSSHRGAIAMQTRVRPDEIEHATVQLGTVNETAEALARATIHHFYGIDVVDWNRSAQQSEVQVVEGAESLRAPESGFSEDLIRAWFILSSLTIPSHVFLVHSDALETDRVTVQSMVEALRAAAAQSDERRRELRRNISGDHDLDREKVTEFFNDQTTRLTRTGRKGWMDLTNRVARTMDLPTGASPDVVSFGLTKNE